MRERARAVVVGGGVGGCSILYWLARLGWDDVVLVERADLTSGSTFHSAGLVGQLRGTLALTRMMMESVELYRALEAEVGLETGWQEVGSLRLASSPERMEELARQAGWAKTFGLPLELVSANEAQERFPPMSTDGVLGAALLPTDGYVDPSQLTFALAEGARKRGAESRRVPASPGSPSSAAASLASRPTAAPSRRRSSSTPAGCTRARSGSCGRERPDRPHGARVPRDEARGPAARHADDARPLVPRLLQAGVGWPRDGRVRAALRSVGARRDPGRLQLAPPRGGLAALRGADGERRRAGAVALGDGDREAHQRARGVHAGRRVHPGAVRRARLLGGFGLLRARAGRGGRDGKARRRVDRRGDAVARRLAHGLATLRERLPQPRVHSRAHARGLRDVLRRQVSRPRALGGAPAASLLRVRAAAGARCGVRGEVGLGARELVRIERSARRRVAATARLGREALVARDRSRAPRLPRGGRDLRRELVREDPRRRGRRGRTPRAPLRQPGRTRGRPGDVHADAELARRHRVRLHRHPAGGGRVPDRHRHRLRPARPRVDPAARSGRRLGPGLGRDLPVRVLRPVGAERPGRSSQPLTTTDLSNEAFPYMRARELAVGRVPCLALRVTYVGELGWELYCPAEFGARALGHDLGGRPRRTASSPAATRRSTRSDSRRATASGARTSRPRTRRSRPGSDSRSSSTRAATSSAATRSSRRASPSACSAALRSTIRARSPSARSRCGSGTSSSGASRAAAMATRSSARSRMRTSPPSTSVGTEVEVEIFGEWVEGEIAAEPLFDPSGERIRA